jgi:hypothetical protein
MYSTIIRVRAIFLQENQALFHHNLPKKHRKDQDWETQILVFRSGAIGSTLNDHWFAPPLPIV